MDVNSTTTVPPAETFVLSTDTFEIKTDCGNGALWVNENVLVPMFTPFWTIEIVEVPKRPSPKSEIEY